MAQITESKPQSSLILFVIEVIALAALMGLLVWTFPPDVNEAHYLAKAKHFWDRSFCTNDIFVSSQEVHWLFYFTHGWICRFLPFESVAWIGRAFAWLVTAWGMVLLCRSFDRTRGLSLLIGGLVVVLNLRLNLAGEWFVGGVEGKCYAYGFAFAAMAMWFQRQRAFAAACIGIACGFHIVVGLWFVVAWVIAGVIGRVIGLVIGRVMKLHRADRANLAERVGLHQDSRVSNSPKQSVVKLLAVVTGALFFAVGFWPAITQNAEIPNNLVAQASHLQSLSRLAHHQLATEFNRWGFFIPLVLAWLVMWRTNHGRNAGASRSLNSLNVLVLASLLIALCGIIISCAAANLLPGSLKDSCARILTLYLFRLSDVMVPLGFAFNGLIFLTSLSKGLQSSLPLARYAAMVTAALLALVAHGNFQQNKNDPRSGSARQAVAFPFDKQMQAREIQANQNWIKTCHWIRENLPADAMFITPYAQQTFKWYAHRSEVASRKDMPQDAPSVLIWDRCLNLMHLGDTEGWPSIQGTDWNQEVSFDFLPPGFRSRLADVAVALQADYMIVEQRLVDEFLLYYSLPKCLTQIHPKPGQRKSTFVIYEFEHRKD